MSGGLRLLIVISVCGFACAENITLARKAEIFQQDMQTRFLLDGQALCKLRNPGPGHPEPTYNMPDNAYMTGIYLGTLSMKFALTKDPVDRENARKSIQALHLLCTVSGKPGLLARAAWPADRPLDDDGGWMATPDGQYKWRGDVSSDQVDGVLFGYSMAFDWVADDAEKAIVAGDVRAIVDHIESNDLTIVDVDGKPTRWGRYGPKYIRFERLNALLWLQALKIAHHVTGEDRYGQSYRRYAVDEKYAELAVKTRSEANPAYRHMVNHSDDVLWFLGIEPLLRYETDDVLRRYYLDNLTRSWHGAGKHPGLKGEANPLHAFLAAKYLADASEIEAAINTLHWFPFDIKWNRDTVGRYQEKFQFPPHTGPKSPPSEPGKPIPIDRRQKTWSAWVQDPYHSAGDRTEETAMEYNGHDYLLAYWLGRSFGFITESQ